MESTKRAVSVVTFILLFLSVFCQLGALVSQQWINFQIAKNSSTCDRCELSSGLFEGIRTVDHQFGPRSVKFYVFDELGSLLPTWQWVSALTMLCSAAVIDVIACLIAFSNVFVNPYQVMAGLIGVALFSLLAGALTLIVRLLFAITLWFTTSYNLLPRYEIDAGFLIDFPPLRYGGYSVCLLDTSIALHAATFVITSVWLYLKDRNVVIPYIFNHSNPTTQEKQAAKYTVDSGVFMY